jgi:hypothetical protein
MIDQIPAQPNPGLCQNCQHIRRMESDRGSVFIMCKLSFEDSRFAKYPRLPVLSCGGYRPAGGSVTASKPVGEVDRD